jgi:hypothetical protein
MKLTRYLVTALVVALIGIGICAPLSGCTANVQKQSVAQILAVVCPQLSLANTQLTAFNAVLIADPSTNTLGTQANKDLAKWQAPINALCAAGATVTSTQLNAELAQILPALGAIVGTLPLPPATEAQIQGALVLAEGAVGLAGVVEAQIAATKAAPASASTAAAAQ